jgi:hypothetical protein
MEPVELPAAPVEELPEELEPKPDEPELVVPHAASASAHASGTVHLII